MRSSIARLRLCIKEDVKFSYIPVLVTSGASAANRAVMVASEFSLATLELSDKLHFLWSNRLTGSQLKSFPFLL